MGNSEGVETFCTNLSEQLHSSLSHVFEEKQTYSFHDLHFKFIKQKVQRIQCFWSKRLNEQQWRLWWLMKTEVGETEVVMTSCHSMLLIIHRCSLSSLQDGKKELDQLLCRQCCSCCSCCCSSSHCGCCCCCGCCCSLAGGTLRENQKHSSSNTGSRWVYMDFYRNWYSGVSNVEL